MEPADDFEVTDEVTPLKNELGQLLYQGAESRVYDGSFMNRPAIIKERFSKKYRHADLDERITKERMRSELRCIGRARMCGVQVPAIYFVDSDKNRIVMEKICGAIPLREYICNQGCLKEGGDKNSRLNEISTEIGQIVGTLHSNQILHGDLTTSNMMLKVNDDGSLTQNIELILIDFGLGSIDSNQKMKNAESRAVDLFVLEKALLSTHPNSEAFFESIMSSYKKTFASSAKVIAKLDEIRLRGRKRDMVG